MARKFDLKIVVLVAFGLLVNVAALWASPMMMTDAKGKVIPGNPRWPQGTTIHVYVPDDPRFDDIKIGIERWAAALAGHDLHIDVQKGPPPAGAANAVEVKFVAPATLGTDSKGEPNQARAGPKGAPVTKEGKQTAGPITGGAIDVSTEVNKDGTESDYLKNLAQHEFGHVLGLDDEPTEDGKPHNVMDHEVESTATAVFTAKDHEEINSIYASANVPTPTGTTTSQVTPLPGQENAFLFTALWQEGATIPFVQIGTNGAPIVDITADGFSVAGTNAFNPNPAGWFLLDAANRASLAGSIEDVLMLFDGEGGDYLTFLNLTNPLGPQHLSAIFGFRSTTGVAPVLTFLTADNFITVQGPAPIPEPATALTIGVGICVGIAARRRRTVGWFRSSRLCARPCSLRG